MADQIISISPTDYTEFSIDFSGNDTFKTIEIRPGENYGMRKPFIWGGEVKIPNWENNVLLDLSFSMPVGLMMETFELDARSSLVRGGQRSLSGLNVPCPRPIILTLSLSGIPGGDGGTIIGILWSSIEAKNISIGEYDFSFSSEFSASDTEKIIPITIPPSNGTITRGEIVIPNWINDVSLGLEFFTNLNGTEIILDNRYNSLSRNQQHSLDLNVPTSRPLSLKLSLSDTPGGTASIVGVFFLDSEPPEKILDLGNSGISKEINWIQSRIQKVILTDDCTFTFVAPYLPQSCLLYLVQDATGGHAVTWPTSVRWDKNIEPTWITTGDETNLAFFNFDGTNFLGAGWLPG